MTVKNCNYVTIYVDYVEMSTVQCVQNMMSLTLEKDFGRIKSFITYSYVDRRVSHEHFVPHRKLLLYYSKKELPRFSALARNSV